MKYLVITESPAKIKKLTPILSKSDINGTFIYDSTIGHIINLEGKTMSIDIENNYEPTWTQIPDKTKVISSLRSKIKQVDHVLIASDPDLAGEFIAWSILYWFKVPKTKYNRVTFNAITKDAVIKGIKYSLDNNIKIDMNQVYAEQTRRLLDRLIGYSLSPIVRKIVSGESAGRCQSPVARLVYERDQEISKFEGETFFQVSGIFKLESQIIDTKLNDTFKNKNTTEKFLKKIQNETFYIKDVKKSTHKSNAQLPFNTMTLLIHASNKMGWSVNSITANLQQLYMNGYITYIRTDSTLIDSSSIPELQNCVTNLFNKSYLDPEKTKKLAMTDSKKKGNTEQQGHECIRVTDPTLDFKQITDATQRKLYVMIWKRTLAALMNAQEYNKFTIQININKNDTHHFIGSMEEVIYDGFMKIYNEFDNDGEKIKPEKPDIKVLKLLKSLVGNDKSQKIEYDSITALENSKSPPGYFSEATLIKKMKDLKIGRPATVKGILEKNLERKYIEKFSDPGKDVEMTKFIVTPKKIDVSMVTKTLGASKNKLKITTLGQNVVSYLCKDFKDIMDYDYTSNLEQDIISIEEGKTNWVSVVDKFYKQFSLTVENTNEKFKNDSNYHKRSLGKSKNLELFAYNAKWGPVIQMGIKKPNLFYAKVPEDMNWETITKEQAEELLKKKITADEVDKNEGLPQITYNDQQHYIETKLGKFGPFICLTKVPPKNKKEKPIFIGLKGYLERVKCEDYKDLTLDLMKQILKIVVEDKIKSTFKNHDKWIVELKKVGKFGPYIQLTDPTAKKVTKVFVSIPKSIDIETITQIQVTELIDKKLNNPTPSKRGRPKKKNVE